jgi:hypothetical protein
MNIVYLRCLSYKNNPNWILVNTPSWVFITREYPASEKHCCAKYAFRYCFSSLSVSTSEFCLKKAEERCVLTNFLKLRNKELDIW